MLYYFNMSEIKWSSRWSKDQIRALLIEQMDSFLEKDTGVQRKKLAEIKTAASLPHAVIVSGLRRVGKSTLLAQLAKTLEEDSFYYLNFEDDRFIGFTAEDANGLYENLVEIFGERKIFIMDEIQNVLGWEHFVRRFMDMGFKFFITGSNASLLSQEVGTRLTGRYIPIELFPFSFGEYLEFNSKKVPDLTRLTTVERARLNGFLNDYLSSGGIPDALKYPELPLLRTLYDDVLHRDIATRYKLSAVTALKELAYYLISNPSELVTFNKLKTRLQLGSVNTITSYVEYMKNSWLIFVVNMYTYSLKRQQLAPKKVCCIDNGMVNSVGFRFSPNMGKLMENLVYLTLRQRTKDLYYYLTSKGHEVDFYLPGFHQLIQVSQNMKNATTREREIRTLSEAIEELPVKSALILSDADENVFQVNKIPVEIKSIPKWLLEQELNI